MFEVLNYIHEHITEAFNVADFNGLTAVLNSIAKFPTRRTPGTTSAIVEVMAQIRTAIESALFVPWKNVERVLPFTDLLYADIKLADSDRHRLYTGQGNEQILENLQLQAEASRLSVLPSVKWSF